MIVKVTITEEHIKGATMNALPSELLIISTALHDFAENEDRNLQDRADAEKMRKDIHFALAEEEDQLKFYYVESIDDYWVGRRLDNFYYANWHEGLGFIWSHSRYLPWGEHVVDERTLWKEHTYPSEPIEISFTDWIVGFVKKYFADRPKNMIHIDDVYRLIAGHSDYHGDSILSAFTCLVEGKDVKPIAPLDESADRPTRVYEYLRERIGDIVDSEAEFEAWFERMVWHVEECNRLADRPTGEWIDADGNKVRLDADGHPLDSCWCSNCGEWLVASDEHKVLGKFCPNCGKRMHKGGDTK